VLYRIRDMGQSCTLYQADVTRPEQARGMVERVITDYGKIDILINNVGRYFYKDIAELSPAEWLSTIELNLNGTFFCSKYALEYMRRQAYGRIVNIAAAGADYLRAARFNTPYIIAKTGVIILTRSLAVAEARHGITVNAVAPGHVDKGDLSPSERERLVQQIPMARMAEMTEIAEAVSFLVSDKAQYITGSCLTISGGWRI